MTEIDLTPITRLEYDIDAILNDHAVAEPITRIELILTDIVAGNTTTVVPVTRIETYLAIISGADYPVPEPVTRIETFLAIIAGEDYEKPEAVTRLEGLLAEWVEKGSGIWKTLTGTLLHITDALASPMQKCEVTFEPIQDLHGQDAPYPAGGGKNKFDQETLSDFSNYPNLVSSYYYTGKIQLKPNTTYYIYPTDDTSLSSGYYVLYIVQGNDPDEIIISNASVIYPVYGGVIGNTQANRVFTTKETGIIRFGVASSAALSSIMSKTWQMAERQGEYDPHITPFDYSPYSNICPITGWTGCEVTRLGANILPYPYVDSSVTRSGITFTVNNDYTVTVNGTASNDVTFELCRTYPYSNDELVLGKTIKLTGCPQNGSQSTYYLSAVITGHKDTGNGVSFTINNVGYFRFAIVIKSGVTVNNLIFKPMVVVGTEQQDYEPYSGTTLSVTFPETVYGGKYEFVSGELKSTLKAFTYNSAEYYGVFEGHDLYYVDIPNYDTQRIKPRGSVYDGSILLSNYFTKIAASSARGMNNCEIRTQDNTIPTKFYFRYDEIESLNALNALLAVTPLQVIAELAEPLTYQLTPQEISTLAGENNVWSNTNGDTTVIYKAQSS